MRDDTIDCFKVQTVAKGYTKIFGFNHVDTSSPMAKMASVCLFLPMTAIRQSPFISWTSTISSYRVISLNKFIWSNSEGLFLKGEFLDWFVIFTNIYIGLKQSPQLGLANLALNFSSSAWHSLRLTTLCWQTSIFLTNRGGTIQGWY